ncbi:hypothetical protein V1477_009649 [Vespula maculifrons]|uniref:Uncharacterized protein n=1 Tax=Vespula maculifrons TaxID=7453 RepID=A0ABD2CAE6_VESMC
MKEMIDLLRLKKPFTIHARSHAKILQRRMAFGLNGIGSISTRCIFSSVFPSFLELFAYSRTVTSGPSRILPFITNPIGRGRVFLALESAGESKGNVDTSISSSFDGSNEVTGTTVISNLYYEVSGKEKTCRKIYRLQDLLFSKYLTREFMLFGILSDKTIIDSGRNKASALSFVISIRSSKLFSKCSYRTEEELRFCEHEANAYFSCVPSQASDRNVLPSTQELNSLQITYLKRLSQI